MKFQMTIARKLAALSLLAVTFMAGVGVAGLFARHYLTVGSERVLASQEILRYQMQADQAHDALRGDVLAALLSARDVDEAEVKAVQAELHAHTNELIESMQKMELLEL